MGGGDAVVDNACSGGAVIGFDDEGNLRDYAYRFMPFEKIYDNGTGFPFKGYSIPETKKAIELAMYFHKKYLPTQGMIAWDWALREDGSPVMIELNLGDWKFFPGVYYFQMACGEPIFGDRTSEVIEFVKENYGKIRDSMYWIR